MKPPYLYLRCALCAVVCAGLFAWFGLKPSPVDNEVFNLYAGAKLGPGELYHPERYREVAASLGAKVMDARLYYCRMPYYEVLTKPLSWLPYPAAVAAWRLVQILALAAALFLWPGGKPTMAMVALVSLPVVWEVTAGQDVALVFLSVAASAALARRGRCLLAGVIFSFCLAKPHLVIFVPLVMLALRDFRFLAGAAAGACGQILLSFAVAPASWPRQWLSILSDARMHPYVNAMPGLRAMAQTGPGMALAVLIVISLTIAIWKLARRLPLGEAMAYALAAGIVANLHSYAVDCILLIPAIAFSLRSRRVSERVLGIVLATPVPYLALIMGAPLLLQTGILALVHLAWAPWAARREPAAVETAGDIAAGS
jgi:hypothetical protein